VDDGFSQVGHGVEKVVAQVFGDVMALGGR
jgi:hypothetical protein